MKPGQIWKNKQTKELFRIIRELSRKEIAERPNFVNMDMNPDFHNKEFEVRQVNENGFEKYPGLKGAIVYTDWSKSVDYELYEDID